MNEFRDLEAHEDELKDEVKRQEWEEKHDKLKSKKKKIDRKRGFDVDQGRNMTDHQRETWVTDEERRLELMHDQELSKLNEDPVAKDPTKIPMQTICLASSMSITLILLRRGMEVDVYCSSWPNFMCIGSGWREASIQLNSSGETELDVELSNKFSIKGGVVGFVVGAALWFALAFTVLFEPLGSNAGISAIIGLAGMIIFAAVGAKALFGTDKKKLNLVDLVDVRYREQTKGKRSVDPVQQDGRIDLIFSDPRQAEVCIQFKNEEEENFVTGTTGAIDKWFQKFFNGQQIAAFIATGIEGLSRHVWTHQNEEYLKEFTDDVQLERHRIAKWMYDTHRVNSKLLKIEPEKWLDPEDEKHRKPRDHQHEGRTKMMDSEEGEEANEDYDMFGKVLI
jgi:hypothetical protein